MLNHIARLQGFITISLFVLFVILMGVTMFAPQVDADQPFALVAGWLGIVIGFFFNQQFSEALKKKLEQSENLRRRKSEKVFENLQRMRTEYQAAIEDSTSKNKNK